jgi:hypothetical protein
MIYKYRHCKNRVLISGVISAFPLRDAVVYESTSSLTTHDKLRVCREVGGHGETDSSVACLEFYLVILWLLRNPQQYVLCVPQHVLTILNSDLLPVLEYLEFRCWSLLNSRDMKTKHTFCLQTILSLEYIQSSFNPVQTFTPDSCKLHCNVVLSYRFCLPRSSIVWVFPTDFFIHFISNMLATCPV